ncbi:SpoIID/LytB domain-containing protein [Rhodococcus sp. ABRD24]|uniref:SpoIID/LytB domain-containing protein n=1 Tax=Rhodococcus sp. ABRD24 TaxID=2507582 RepID=UPI00103997C1|nr:SpoIID/LytB domain-containing protein [Rhodococcus sp. ABRD24]QBJ96684.1 SpoIID/LytB domain-containing protein [Rhodococcus sp. ABRD24]
MANPRFRATVNRGGRTRRKRFIVGRRPSLARVTAFGLAPALVVGTAVALFAVDRSTGPSIAPVVAADTQYTLNGHGYGHGRGMGQYGAYGYAKNHGWPAERILGHYYGNTTLGPIDDPMVGVRLVGRDDKRLDVYSPAGLNVAGRYFGPNSAAYVTPKPGGADVVITAGCGGREVWRGSTNHPWVDPVNLAPDRPGNEHLRMCDGNVPYRGAMGALRDGGGAWRTVNRVAMEDYLYGVVPAESIPSWADSGGKEALRAQAVAARSYAAAENRYGYAETCDTQSCQVYGGSSREDWRTSEAVRSTFGKVLKRGNKIMAAEFSSSSGGFTAGGVFPAVVDDGDVVSPNRNWTQTVSAGQIANAFGVGELHAFEVIGRNNLGADGGRVTRVRVVGSARTVEATGDEARWKLGLKSDWFTVNQGAGIPGIPGLPLPPGSLDAIPLPPLPELSPGSLGAIPLPPLPPIPLPALPPLPGSVGPVGIAEPIAAPVVDSLPAADLESPIEAKYRELGGPAGTLGEPTGPEMMLPDESGKFRSYVGGTIVWTPSLGAQAVDSNVVLSWLPATSGGTA